MIDRKEIELLIKAQLQGRGNIAQVTKAIGDLEKQIEAQAAAAKRGENSIDELKGSLEELKQVQQQLTQRAESIGYFQKLSKAIEATEDRVDRTGKAYQKFADKVKAQGETTEAEATRLAKLAGAYDRAQASLKKQQGTLNELQATLKESGVDVNNLAAAEFQLRDAAASLGTVLAKGQQTLSGYARDVREAREATAAAAKEANVFTAAEEKATKARQARAKAEQEFNDRVSARRAEGAASSRQFDETARVNQQTALAAEFVKRWAAQLDELDRNNALRKQADDAEQATRSYSTLARAATNLQPKIVSIREAVDAIVNPSKEAQRTLGGVEKSVADLTKTIQGIKGPVKDANALYKELGDSQKALAGQASLLDTFRKQSDALRNARQELSAARTSVAQYAAEVRKGGESGAQFVKALTEAQARAKTAADAMRQQLAATRESREALRAAGIDTNNLSAAQQRLISTTQATAASTKQLTEAVKQYGVERQRAGRSGGGLFEDEGRTTLSLLQRIRGQVLALAAAYVGLQGAVGLAGDAIEASNNREASKSILGVSLNTIDRKAIDEEYEYVRAQSERIGLVFDDTVKQYAKFATAAAKSGRSRQEIRYIFESFAEGGRVLNLTTDNLNGVFLALQQIFSKGKLGAEELRQQLGERLPGVFEVAQQALRDQFPDLNKAMEQGKVGAEQLVKVAEAYRKMVAEQLPGATKGMIAQQARMTNAVNEFKIAIADGGFADAYIKAIQQITTFLKSEDGANFAKSLSSAFSAIADAVVFLLKHLDELKLVLGVIVGLWAANSLQKMTRDMVEASKAIRGMTGDVTNLQKAFFALQAFIVGWNIGSYLYEKFAVVRIIGVEMVANFEKAWTRIKYGAQILFEEAIPSSSTTMTEKVLNDLTFFLRKVLGLWRDTAKAIGNGDLVAKLDQTIANLTFGTNRAAANKVAQLKQQMEADIAAINKIAQDSIAYEMSQGVKVLPKPTAAGTPTGFPGSGGKTKDTGPTDAEIKRRASEIEAITRALEQLQAKIDRTQTETLSKQLDAIDEQYAALARRIEKLGGKTAVDFMKELNASVEELKLQTTRKFNDKLAAEQESLQTKIEQAEAAAGRKQKENLDVRLAAVTSSYAATYRDIEALRDKLVQNGRSTDVADEMQRRAQLAEQEQKQFVTQQFYKDELLRREKEIDAVIAQRSSRIKSINDELEAGLITQQQADEQIAATIALLQPQIDELATSGEDFAASIRDAFDPVRVDEFTAKLRTARGSANGVDQTFKQLAKTIEEQFVNGTVSALDKVGVALGEAALGTKSWADTVVSIREAFKQFAADFLRMIAQMILKQIVLNALQAAGGSGSGGWGAAIASLVAHDGGVVGSSHGRSRSVSPGWFAGAPRYHGGGISGMSADEYPAILQEGEEVLAKDSPRNIMNGGAGLKPGGDNIKRAKSTRFVLVDDRSRVPEAMNSPEGEEVILMNIKANIPTIRQWMKG